MKWSIYWRLPKNMGPFLCGEHGKRQKGAGGKLKGQKDTGGKFKRTEGYWG